MPHIRSTRLVTMVPSWARETVRPASALVSQQAVLAHEPENPATAGADAVEAQPRPQLAVTLAMKGRGRQEPPDRLHQLFVRHGTERPGSSALDRLRLVAMAVDGRSRHAPDPRHPLQAVDPVRGGRDPRARRLDLRRAKGRRSPARCSPIRGAASAKTTSPLPCGEEVMQGPRGIDRTAVAFRGMALQGAHGLRAWYMGHPVASRAHCKLGRNLFRAIPQ